jgi:soluble lytic murein transglycosylase-like protein
VAAIEEANYITMVYPKELITLAKEHAGRYELDPCLVCAVVEQESGWNPYAIRVERRFWQQYGETYRQRHPDLLWLRYPDLFAASYGLMQVMYPVAVEYGFRGRFPTELCDARESLNIGCKILRSKIETANDGVEAALLRWNGGGRPEYPSEVLARVSHYVVV